MMTVKQNIKNVKKVLIYVEIHVISLIHMKNTTRVT